MIGIMIILGGQRMLDNVLIIMIFLFITLSFFIVKVWKKKHFAKELYISEGASIAFLL